MPKPEDIAFSQAAVIQCACTKEYDKGMNPAYRSRIKALMLASRLWKPRNTLVQLLWNHLGPLIWIEIQAADEYMKKNQADPITGKRARRCRTLFQAYFYADKPAKLGYPLRHLPPEIKRELEQNPYPVHNKFFRELFENEEKNTPLYADEARKEADTNVITRVFQGLEPNGVRVDLVVKPITEVLGGGLAPIQLGRMSLLDIDKPVDE